MRPHELPVALLILWVELGVFLLFWSIDKMWAPEQTAKRHLTPALAQSGGRHKRREPSRMRTSATSSGA